MDYIVSARKYRPLSFDSVVGQAALTETLKNSVRTGKLAHAYLFCGPRGVGKTTCARIFAKAINCMNPTADGEACCECESCKAFAEQRSFNIFELDAASNNSVEHIKQLMDQTRIPPQVGKYKVFIIDEVHMLSTAAFNAFLKTLEEPPSYVIFILATTEKHKLLPTIISRCQIYDFERMTVPGIIGHLKYVAEKEGIVYEEEALNVIAEKADGGMRDALSVFDQAVSFCQGNITYKKVIEDLNVLDSENYFQILDNALANNVTEIMLVVNRALSKGFDGGQLISGFAAHLRNIMLAKDSRTVGMLQVSEAQKARFTAQAAKCTPTFIYKALRLLNNCDVNYRQSSNKRLLVELTLIEVAQLTQPDDPASGRRPNELKPLFNLIVRKQQSNNAGPQVSVIAVGLKDTPDSLQNQSTASSSVAGTPVTGQSVAPSDSGVASGSVAISKSPLSSGFTFKNYYKKQNETAPQEAKDEVIEMRNTFTEESLLNVWLSMCNRMPPQLVGLAQRLKNMEPKIEEFPNVSIVVGNSMLMEEIAALKPRIEATLRKDLQNGDITLSLSLAKAGEMKRILTPRERYEKFREENVALRSLFDMLDLTVVG